MEFDWLDAPFDLRVIPPKEIEETFEDPFSLRLLPDVEIAGAGHARYFNLGKTIGGQGVFTIFWTDGKRIRCLLSRAMTSEDLSYYDRKNQELS